jgi:hypothetical protein
VSSLPEIERFVRNCVELGVPIDPASVKQMLGVLDRTRERVSDLEQQLREIRGEKCEHWVDGPGSSRIPIPDFGCRHCA